MLRSKKTEVELHVPPADPTADMIKGAAAVAATVQELVDDRNRFKQNAEYMACQFEAAQNTIRRMELEHDHQFQIIAQERDYWRNIAVEQIATNGELSATITGMIGFAQNAKKTLMRVKNLTDQVTPVRLAAPKEDEEEEFDDGPPEIDLDGVKTLAKRLAAAVPQQ